MPEPACPVPHDYLAPLSTLSPFGSYEDKLDFYRTIYLGF